MQHSIETINKVKDFLTPLDEETLELLINKRKKLKEKSDKFLLKHMENPKLCYMEGKDWYYSKVR